MSMLFIGYALQYNINTIMIESKIKYIYISITRLEDNC